MARACALWFLGISTVVLTTSVAVPVAQTPGPTFEVASVKPHTSDDQRSIMTVQPGGRFTMRNEPLRLLIRTAYQLQDDQIVGGPAWLSSDRFDIDAKAPDEEAFLNRLAAMLQALLADRFGLRVHHDSKELPVFVVVLARSDGRPGPQLRPTECPDLEIDLKQLKPCTNLSPGLGRFTARGTPMKPFLDYLAPFVNRVIVDRSGLNGRYDITLEWTPDNLPQRAPGTAADQPLRLNGVAIDPNGPTIFTAMQEQLGLKLQSTRGSVDVLVIDHVEQPTED
jgi:uncharacterized protein (TIGR03435 family)